MTGKRIKHYVALLIGLLLAVGIGGAEESDDMRWTTYEDEYISFEYPAALVELMADNSPEHYGFYEKIDSSHMELRLEIMLGLSSVSYHIRLDGPDDDVTPYTRIIESVDIKI